MSTSRCAFLAVWMVLLSSLCAEEKKDPRETLEGAVAECARLLEAKDYVNVLKQFVPPDKMKDLPGKIEDVAKDFGERKAGELLKAMQFIKDKKAEMSDEGKKATFKLPEDVFKRGEISFIKVDKYWYIDK